MWFKQVTCDTCFTPLAEVSRHNKYYFSRILEFKKQSRSEFLHNQGKYSEWLNYDTVPYGGTFVYSYRIDGIGPQNYFSWFCCNKCAVEEAKKTNSILFYYDEKERSVAFVTPHCVEINRSINELDYTPLLIMAWGEENWFMSGDRRKDLRQYGSNTEFPVLKAGVYYLAKPTETLCNAYKALTLEHDFEIDYWGSDCEELRADIQRKFPKLLDSMRIDFGRRASINWLITDINDNFIGFIEITGKYPAFPGQWTLEFGLVKRYRHKGIMKVCLRRALDWAQQNGCKAILAISEKHNVACHKLLRNLPYNIVEQVDYMSDAFAGYRPMHLFKITL